jgi:hypothetical protein
LIGLVGGEDAWKQREQNQPTDDDQTRGPRRSMQQLDEERVRTAQDAAGGGTLF